MVLVVVGDVQVFVVFVVVVVHDDVVFGMVASRALKQIVVLVVLLL